MLGLMQDRPLLQSQLVVHAARFHGRREVVSWSVEGPVHRTDWATVELRSRKLAQAMARLGVGFGDRVATLAWNSWRHLEIWFAVSGMGAVAHTVNPRLFREQIVYILNHAQGRVLFVDLTFVPLLEALAGELEHLRHVVIMTDRAHMPETGLPGVRCHEELVEAEDGDFVWPEFDERTASGLCYTSGTTGQPKGVLYSHRSTVIHTFATALVDTLGIGARDAVLPVVPMFHANGWGIPWLAAMTGAKLVFNGRHHDPETICEMFESEQVTISAGVPTVWLGLLNHLRATGKRLATLRRVTIGGSAAPRSMIEEFEKVHGVQVAHLWGMTELNPLGTVGTPTAETAALDEAAQLDIKCKQGRAVFGVEMRIVDEDGAILPHDGKSFGHLMVRGPWTAAKYFRHDEEILDKDGFFDTGDVATLDRYGYMQITDRSKDVIKSGGEWISSIDLENIAVGHPDVREAAVIGVSHPKWDERPLLVIVTEPGKVVSRAAMLDWLSDKVARWWLPDDVVTVAEIPHTATGKILKSALREQFRDYRLPTAETAS